MAIDPVCKMHIDENDAQYKVECGEQTYYFCREECMKIFKFNTIRYT